MITLNQMRYQILEALNQYSDDSRITVRLIDNLIKTKRAMLIRREHNKNRSIDPSIIQKLNCVDIQLVSSVDCPDVCTDEPDLILKTKKQIPNTIELNHDKTITRVGTVDIKSRSVFICDYDAAIYWGNGRFNKSQLCFFLLNNYGYLNYKDPKFKVLEKIEIQGVFEDPKEAARFSDCDGKPCWTPDSPYPLNLWMWDIIKAEIIKELLPTLQIPTDKNNNADDDSEISTTIAGK